MKRRARIAGNILIILLILVASAIVIVRLLVRPGPPTSSISPRSKRSATGNDALACSPEFFCSAKIDLMIAPVVMSAAALAAKVKELPNVEPRTVMIMKRVQRWLDLLGVAVVS
jgi:hypothetical protein